MKLYLLKKGIEMNEMNESEEVSIQKADVERGARSILKQYKGIIYIFYILNKITKINLIT